ncbi:MAG TPA: hypothetical protein PKX91_05070 [Clostridia bacterium]|jgi:hypothetical protein|nr:hypothetical protein [Clostridia bacterium]
MKKKLIVTIVSVVLCVLIALTLVGCKENYKQKALAMDWNNIAVSSNNGLAVRVGDYLYFINGYADKTGDNDFGKTVKGAIMRVELENNLPVRDTLETVVPKNVYNSNASLGLVVKGEYIYYSTPAVTKDGKGNPQTDKMDLMRTKLDGTGTQKLATFDDFNTVYQVMDEYILYTRENKLFELNLGSKSFKTKEVADKVNSAKFLSYNSRSDVFSNVVLFDKNDEGVGVYKNIVYAYTAGSGEPKVIIDGLNSYQGKVLEHEKGYRITLTALDLLENGNLRVYYSKSDSTPNSISKGSYSYDFDKNFSFDWNKEVRYTTGTTYTRFDRLNANNIMTLDDKGYHLGVYDKDVKTWNFTPIIDVASIQILSYEEVGADVVVTYVTSNKLRKIKVLEKVADAYNPVVVGVETLYSGPYFSTWLTYDKVYNTIYFFNSDVKNYTYYLDLSAVVSGKSETMTGTRLGAFSRADEISMLEAPPTETKDKK